MHRYPGTSTAELSSLSSRVRVVGCTCLSSRHPLLARRAFDVCIVDEASQISVPAVLGPLMLARAFLLVGDHYQLSPLVTSAEAQRQGFGTSLFRRLSEAHPQVGSCTHNLCSLDPLLSCCFSVLNPRCEC